MVTNGPRANGQLAAIGRVFTPSTPVTDAAVFAGRQPQRERLLRAIFEPGRHAVVYRARGIGKTSLANIMSHTLSAEGGAAEDSLRLTTRVPCTREDTFDSVWRALAREVSIVPIAGADTVVERASTTTRMAIDTADAIFDHPGIVSPADVERTFRHATRAVLVFDEFDTLLDRESSAKPTRPPRTSGTLPIPRW